MLSFERILGVKFMRVFLFLFFISFFLSGCITSEFAARKQFSFINYNNETLPPHDESYPIDLYFQGKPEKSYEVIGEVMGQVRKDKHLRELLETKARQVGADGVIEIQTSMRTATFSEISRESVNDSKGNVVGYMPVSEISTLQVIDVKGKMIKYK